MCHDYFQSRAFYNNCNPYDMKNLVASCNFFLTSLHASFRRYILNSSKCTCNKSGIQTHKRQKHSSVNVCRVYLREKIYLCILLTFFLVNPRCINLLNILYHIHKHIKLGQTIQQNKALVINYLTIPQLFDCLREGYFSIHN